MVTPIEDLTPVAFGRILERLEQQDTNSILRETEARNIAIRIATDLEKHTTADTLLFTEINKKLDSLLELKASIKGGKAIMWTIWLMAASMIGWAINYFAK